MGQWWQVFPHRIVTEKLHAFLQRQTARPFTRGVWDCCAFVAQWMREVQGCPVDSAFLGKRLTDRQALRIIREAGGLDQLAAVILRRERWNLREGAPQDGDVVIAQVPNCCAGVCIGIFSAGFIVSIGDDGALRLLSLSQPFQSFSWQ